MRGAALADLHLGFRQFPATIDGRNAREVDVERAWEAAVAGVIAAQPDLVTIAGDCFHHPRVSDFAKLAFLDGIERILRRTEASVIVLQGNHEAGKTAEVLTPIALAKPVGRSTDVPRLSVVTSPTRIRLLADSTEKVSVACFPFVTRGSGESYTLEPDPDADVNVLLMHAAVRGDTEGDRLPYFYGGDQALDVGREADRWDVIACGDYHEFTRLHPSRLAFYSGSLERTSSDIWKEHAPKGWVLFETDGNQGTLEFKEVPARPMYDLTMEGPPAMDAFSVNEQMKLAIEGLNVPDSILRLKVLDFPRSERELVDWDLVRAIKQKALHFQLDLKYAKRETVSLGDRRERSGRTLSLPEEAHAFDWGAPEVRALALESLGVPHPAWMDEVADVVEEVASCAS